MMQRWVAPFGAYWPHEIPSEIYSALSVARLTRRGMIDRRSPKSLTAWINFCAWAESKYHAETEEIRRIGKI